MSFLIDKEKTAYLSDTPVENIFIGEYMADAPANYVKVYLYGLMAAGSGEDLSDGDIAKALHLTAEDVAKAFAFFEEWGLVEIRGGDRVFVSLKEKLYGRHKEENGDVPKGTASGTNYRRILDNEEMGSALARIQDVVGRFLNVTEQEMIVDWITTLDVEPDMVARAFEYSADRGGKNFKYVGKVINGWAAEGLKSRSDVEEYLAERDQRYYIHKRVMRALGFHRSVTEEEARIINGWTDEVGATMQEILDACAKTAGIGNPNVKYVDAVLRGRKEDETKGVSRQTVMEYYAALRREAEEQAEKARESVYARVPAIREVEEAMAETSRQLTGMLLSGGVDKGRRVEELRERVDQLEKKRDALLTEHSIPVDYMERKYRCRKCGDTGLAENGGLCECYLERSREAEQWLKEQEA